MLLFYDMIGTITYKYGRVVLVLTLVYFAITKLIPIFSYSCHETWIILYNVYFCIVCSTFTFLVDWSQSKTSVVNQRSHLFFWSSKIFFCYFQHFENGHIQNIVSALLNVMTLDIEKKSIVSGCQTLLIPTLK